MVGSSRRFTAIPTIVSAAVLTNTHHSQPSHGVVHADTASVAITAMPTRTSTANAPARVGQAATGCSGAASVAGASAVSSTAVTT